MIEISPSRKKFIDDAISGIVQPVYAELPSLPPVQLFEAIRAPNSFLLQSIKGPEKIARYSFMGAEPFLGFRVKNSSVEISGKISRHLTSSSPIKILRKLMRSFKIPADRSLPPFVGGAVGMISYDFVHYFERLPKTAVDDLDLTDCHFLVFDTVIAIDHKLGKSLLISSPGASEKVSGAEISADSWGGLYDSACVKISALYKKIKTPRADSSKIDHTVSQIPVKVRHEMDKRVYMDMVRRAKKYIKAGDIFQANLSQRVSADIGTRNPWEAYKILSSINPSPFAAYLDMGDYQIASSSPERLVRVAGSTVETRPIAGTRPRGVDAEEDIKMRADLLLNEKERAEHLMLIDLERNDLGKISDYSTVEVDELMITEDYSHVIHIVSNIKGSIAKGKDCFDAIRATFPGGTITGVPKVRCMEIIDELEPVVRGPYTGSVGYISFNGDMDLNIVIRTFVFKNSTAYVQAGAGIVADSDPEKEYYESLKKAEALIKTLEML